MKAKAIHKVASHVNGDTGKCPKFYSLGNTFQIIAFVPTFFLRMPFVKLFLRQILTRRKANVFSNFVINKAEEPVFLAVNVFLTQPLLYKIFCF